MPASETRRFGASANQPKLHAAVARTCPTKLRAPSKANQLKLRQFETDCDRLHYSAGSRHRPKRTRHLLGGWRLRCETEIESEAVGAETNRHLR